MNNYEIIPRIHQIIEFQPLKFDHLLSILRDIHEVEGTLMRIVILTRHDYTAKMLLAELNQRQIRITSVSKSRKARRKRRAADGFNGGRFQVLIVAQSGLDTETGDIHHFINYDMDLPYPLDNIRTIRRRQHG